MTYCIEDFQGIIPRLDPCDLPGNAAVKAENVKLWHGRIEPWRTPRKIEELGDVCSAFVYNCCWRGIASPDATFTMALPCEDVFISVPCQCPQRVKDWCADDPDIHTLGVPEGVMPSIVSATTAQVDEFTESRSYLVTYVNACGEEGAPSLLTDAIKADKNSTVILEVCPPTDTKYDYVTANIYATHDTWDAAQGYKNSDPNAINSGFHSTDAASVECFLIGSVDISGGCVQFTDGPTGDGSRTGRSLTTEEFYPPPEGLIIFGVTDRGSLVGGLGNKIYFSERNAYWAWPDRNVKTLGCNFEGGCVVGNTVTVLTDGRPYLIADDADGSYDGSGARTVRELPQTYPLVSRKSVVCTNAGVVYASDQGLIRITPDGVADMISGSHFSPDDWAMILPGGMTAAEYHGSLFFTTPVMSGVFDLNLRGYTTETRSNLTTLHWCPECWITDKTGALHFLMAGCVYEWDEGDDFMQYQYVSAVTELPSPLSLTAMKIDFAGYSKRQKTPEPVTVNINVNGRDACTKVLDCADTRRISLDNVCDVQVGLLGREKVKRLCLATDTTTLRN